MKNFILSFMVLLGGIVNAQTFDFSCETTVDNTIRYDHPGIDGVSSYNPTTNVLIVEGVEFPTNGDFQATWSHRAPSSWVIGNQAVRFDISNGNYTVGFHSSGGVPTGLTGGRDFAEQIRNLLNHRRVVLPVVTSGNSSFNPNTNQLIVDGVSFDKTDNTAISNSPGIWSANSRGISVINPFSSNNPRNNWGIRITGDNDLVDLTQFDSDDFDGMLVYLRTLKWKPLSHEGAVYNSRENTFSVNGIEFVKHGNRYDAPSSAIDADRWARLSFVPLSNGRYRWEFQNNGLRPCDGYVCAETGGGEYPDFARAVEPLPSRLGNKIFFADRDAAYVNNVKLTNWEGNRTGFTGEKIDNVSYPGIFRFTSGNHRVTGLKVWLIEMQRHGNDADGNRYPVVTHIQGVSEGYVMTHLKSIATNYVAQYNAAVRRQ